MPVEKFSESILFVGFIWRQRQQEVLPNIDLIFQLTAAISSHNCLPAVRPATDGTETEKHLPDAHRTRSQCAVVVSVFDRWVHDDGRYASFGFLDEIGIVSGFAIYCCRTWKLCANKGHLHVSDVDFKYGIGACCCSTGHKIVRHSKLLKTHTHTH